MTHGEKMTQLTDVIAAINLQNQQFKTLWVKGESAAGATNTNGSGAKSEDESYDWLRSTRYEFPKFDENGFEGWVMRAEYFFEVARVPERSRLIVAAIHLEGRAQQWHKGFASLQGDIAYVDWRCYIAAMSARFATHAYEDPLADLRNLKHRGGGGHCNFKWMSLMSSIHEHEFERIRPLVSFCLD